MIIMIVERVPERGGGGGGGGNNGLEAAFFPLHIAWQCVSVVTVARPSVIDYLHAIMSWPLG